MPEEEPTMDWSPELREFRDLGRRVSFADYLASVVNERRLDGAAAEYNEAVFGKASSDGTLPIEMLLDPQERFNLPPEELQELLEAEKRTVITGVASTAGTISIVDRLFSTSEGAHIGATFPMVGPGRHSFPIISGTTTAAVIARDADETPAGGISIANADPNRIQESYEYASADELQMPGLAAGLAADLRQSLMAGLDNKIITDLIAGLANYVPDKGMVVETYANFMSRLGDHCDGRGARAIEDMRALLGARRGTDVDNWSAYERFVTLVSTNGGSILSAIPPGVVRASQHIAPRDGQADQDILLYRGGPAGPSGLIAPVWRQASLLRDTSGLQTRGQITLTGVMYADVVIASTSAYRKGSIHTA